MGNIADPFFPQAHAVPFAVSNQDPASATFLQNPSTRHPGSKNVRGAKNQAKIALQLAKQKHQQQTIISKQAKIKHAQELARVEQALNEQKGTFFEQGIDGLAQGISGSIEPTFFEQGIDGLAQGISENIARPKEDKLKGGYQKKGFQGTRKGNLQKRHTPEFQHPMMNPVPKLKGRDDPYFHSVSASTIAVPQPVSVRYAQEPVENKVQERGFRQLKAETSRIDFALGFKDTGYADVPADPHEIKRQKKNIQISQSGRKTTLMGAGDSGGAFPDYDNTFFEDIRGIPSTFMMYRGTDHERKGTIKEWEQLTPAQQQSEKDYQEMTNLTNNWTTPYHAKGKTWTTPYWW